jgi:hypothetical protein
VPPGRSGLPLLVTFVLVRRQAKGFGCRERVAGGGSGRCEPAPSRHTSRSSVVTWPWRDSLPRLRFLVGCALIIPMIIQTILLDPSGAIWTDEAPNMSRLDPSGAIQSDAKHPTRNRKLPA